jgi:hypothetical protein
MKAIPLSPTLLIGAANAFVSMGENRRGPAREGLVSFLLEQVGVKRDRHSKPRWDAALVYHAGYSSHYDQRSGVSSWPIPPFATCAQISTFAKRHGVLVKDPVPGDLFLLWGPAKHTCIRTGIVVNVETRGQWMNGREYDECVVIEGCTDEERTVGGGKTLRHLRKFSEKRGDRFVRWTALDVKGTKVGRVDAVETAHARDAAAAAGGGAFQSREAA